MVSSATPPHDLELVIEFVNTLNVERGEDRIASPDGLREWLRSVSLIAPDAPPPSGESVASTVALREALRRVLLAHTRAEVDRDAQTELDQTAQLGGLAVSFAPGGGVEIAPRAAGYAGVLAQLLVPVVHATLDGSWQRVKACDAEDCLEAFYDLSRNRSGRWCDMAVCGNRTKVRAYRSKRSG